MAFLVNQNSIDKGRLTCGQAPSCATRADRSALPQGIVRQLGLRTEEGLSGRLIPPEPVHQPGGDVAVPAVQHLAVVRVDPQSHGLGAGQLGIQALHPLGGDDVVFRPRQHKGGDGGLRWVIGDLQRLRPVLLGGGQAHSAGVHPAVGLPADGVEHPHAPLGVAGQAQVVRVHPLIEHAVRVFVLLQQPGQGGVGGVAGEGAGILVAQDDEAPGGQVPEQGWVLGGVHPRAVDQDHGGPFFPAPLQLSGIVGHELLPVLRGLGFPLFDRIGPHGQVPGLDGPAGLHGFRVAVRHEGPPGQPEQESGDQDDQDQEDDADYF